MYLTNQSITETACPANLFVSRTNKLDPPNFAVSSLLSLGLGMFVVRQIVTMAAPQSEATAADLAHAADPGTQATTHFAMRLKFVRRCAAVQTVPAAQSHSNYRGFV